VLWVGDVFGDRRGESDDVVLHLGFDLIDPFDGEVAAIPNGVGGSLRDHARAGERLRRGNFDAQPAAVLVFVGPDAADLQARITCNQLSLPLPALPIPSF